ncbi:LysM peptidoglycan-binding domain-containing protein [Sedimentimonas flavescens]|uniref:LysM peptidoglycan-binding domain-containing protein n=1 Tax=Sedimentimonas flavescens TaxID=2851012 RepID=UPI0021A69269|nr:LysM peptidoglycan-binding domain-containing protein [Sedimentimonas flavescens]MCT2538680.1 LysM peptidoglycan-binding domain-containing protein [Sedimentimonas flavescens]
MKNVESGQEPAAAKAGSGLGGAMLGGVSALALLAVLAGYWVLRDPPQQPAPVAQLPEAAQPEPVAAQPAAEAPTTAAAEPEALANATAAPESEPAPEPASPEPASTEPGPVASLDQFRAAPDGALTLAGRVEPGAKVEVLLDGAVVDTVTAEPGGSFASVVLADPSAEPRQMSVRVTGADGVAREGEESVTVAPSAEAVAQAAEAEGASEAAVAEQVNAAETLAQTPLVTDEQGARVLAEASADLSIDTVSFDTGDQIAVSGRGAPAGALLRAYIDNAEAGLIQAGTEGNWRMVLPAGAPGQHVLRIDALDVDGKVLTRAETSYDRIAPEALAAAEAPAGAEPKRGTRMITIEPGNTLWAIARENYGDPYLYVRLFEANRDQIRDPDLIYPGQVFAIPE